MAFAVLSPGRCAEARCRELPPRALPAQSESSSSSSPPPLPKRGPSSAFNEICIWGDSTWRDKMIDCHHKSAPGAQAAARRGGRGKLQTATEEPPHQELLSVHDRRAPDDDLALQRFRQLVRRPDLRSEEHGQAQVVRNQNTHTEASPRSSFPETIPEAFQRPFAPRCTPPAPR